MTQVSGRQLSAVERRDDETLIIWSKGNAMRIEPIPYDELPEATRAMKEPGTASGTCTTTVPLQIVATERRPR